MSKVRAFMYHDIRDIKEKKFEKRYSLKSFLNCSQFDFQIRMIQKNHEIIKSTSLSNLNLNNEKNYAVLTFDDGLKDHYQVSKYLFDRKINGTFLIPRMPVEQRKVMNTHKIQFLLSVVDEKKLCKDILSNFEDRENIWKKYSQTKWKNNWWSDEMIFITNFLRNFKSEKLNNYEMTDFYFKKFVTSDEEGFAEDLYLNESEINEMIDMDMIIGGHGDISENLLSLENFDDEISRSRDFVLKYTNDDLVFSYPNGGFNDDVKNSLSKNGFKISFTTLPKTITELDDIDFLEFPRYDGPQKIQLN